MKKYGLEIGAAVIQTLMFYVFPLFAGPTDTMGMVVILLLVTFALSLLLGSLSGNRLRLCYPLAAAVLFLPSVPVYYNNTAFIHAVWYPVIAAVGMGVGMGCRFLVTKLSSKLG